MKEFDSSWVGPLYEKRNREPRKCMYVLIVVITTTMEWIEILMNIIYKEPYDAQRQQLCYTGTIQKKKEKKKTVETFARGTVLGNIRMRTLHMVLPSKITQSKIDLGMKF